MIYIGIDPGLSGALAMINEGAGCRNEETGLWQPSTQAMDTPTAETGKGTKREYLISAMADMLERSCGTHTMRGKVFAIIEAVHSMPKQGVASSFSFGRGLGIWEGILSAYRIPYIKVAPQTWKKAMMGDMPRDNKDSSRIVASRLFPWVADLFKRKKDDGRAEALLMAEHGRRIYRSEQ